METYKCDGCGREAECFFPSKEFPIQLEDWTNVKEVKYFNLCNLFCLEKWLEEAIFQAQKRNLRKWLDERG